MWKRVRAVVERNANVRASVREGRGGDVSRVWEWIGSVGLVEGVTWGAGVKKRVSFGPVDNGMADDMAGSLEVEEGRKMAEKRKWDEGRPVY